MDHYIVLLTVHGFRMMSFGRDIPVRVVPEKTCVAPNCGIQSTTLLASADEVRVERCLVLVEKLSEGVEGIASWIEQTLFTVSS